MQFAQDSLGRITDISRYSIFKIGKVTKMYPTSNSVDILFMDNTTALQVPILTGLTSSIFGPLYTVQPNDDTTTPEQTFPTALNNPPCIIDIYAVVSSFYGPRITTGGYFVVGFLMPQLTEMKFPNADQVASNFDRLFLWRHASDVQITVDKNGTTSVQHPSGARWTMGYLDAIDDTDPAQFPVDLKHKDVNGWYDFCPGNQGKQVKNAFIDSSGNAIVEDGNGKITITDEFGDEIILYNGKITIQDKAGDNIIITTDNITITDTAQDIIEITNGLVKVKDTAGDKATMQNGVVLIEDSAGDNVNMSFGTLNINANNVINLTAPTINLNGNISLV